MRVGTHIPKGVLINLHGRLVRQIKVESIYINMEGTLNCDWFLMVEADGRTWLWDGVLDP